MRTAGMCLVPCGGGQARCPWRGQEAASSLEVPIAETGAEGIQLVGGHPGRWVELSPSCLSVPELCSPKSGPRKRFSAEADEYPRGTWRSGCSPGVSPHRIPRAESQMPVRREAHSPWREFPESRNLLMATSTIHSADPRQQALPCGVQPLRELSPAEASRSTACRALPTTERGRGGDCWPGVRWDQPTQSPQSPADACTQRAAPWPQQSLTGRGGCRLQDPSFTDRHGDSSGGQRPFHVRSHLRPPVITGLLLATSTPASCGSKGEKQG